IAPPRVQEPPLHQHGVPAEAEAIHLQPERPFEAGADPRHLGTEKYKLFFYSSCSLSLNVKVFAFLFMRSSKSFSEQKCSSLRLAASASPGNNVSNCFFVRRHSSLVHSLKTQSNIVGLRNSFIVVDSCPKLCGGVGSKRTPRSIY